MYSSPTRTPKLQLAVEQLLTGECWIPPRKDTPCPRAKEKPQKDCRWGKNHIRIKPHTHQRCSEGSNRPCALRPRDPTETEPKPCLSVSCGGTTKQWTAAGSGSLVAVELDMA